MPGVGGLLPGFPPPYVREPPNPQAGVEVNRPGESEPPDTPGRFKVVRWVGVTVAARRVAGLCGAGSGVVCSLCVPPPAGSCSRDVWC